MRTLVRSILVVLALALAGAVVWFATRAPERAPIERAATPVVVPPRIETKQVEPTPEPVVVESRSEPAPAPIEPPPAKPRAGWILHVVESDGTPAAGLDARLLDSAGTVVALTTDAEGVIEREPAEGTALLFVKRRAALPHRAEIELGAGERTLELPAGEELSGRVRENGAAPTRTLLLSLGTGKALIGFVVPAPVREFIENGTNGRVFAQCTTELGGQFRFQGLSSAWSGDLVLPKPYVLADPNRKGFGERRLAVAGPSRTLIVDVERLPCLVGRVLDADGTPLADPVISATIVWSGGDSVMTDAPLAGAPGCFEVALRETTFRSAEFRVSGPGGRNANKFEFERDEIGENLDVGDLRLSAGGSISFRVVGPGGEPVESALVDTESGKPEARSDAQGMGALAGVPASVTTLRARAVGFWIAKRELPSRASEVVVFELQHATRLVVELRSKSELTPQGLKVRLRVERGLVFPDGNGFADHVVSPELGGMNSSGSWSPTGESSQTFRLETKPSIDARNVVAGVPIELTVMDAIEKELHRETLAPLGPTEERHVVVELSVQPRSLAGRVVDETGTPVASANVRLQSGESSSDAALTDETGAFHFDGVVVERMDVVATKKGFADTSLQDVSIPAGGRQIELRLERGHEVFVVVVDALGRTIEGGNVVARDADGREWYPGEREDGRLPLRDLPPRPVTIELALAGRTYSLTHSGAKEVEQFDVPVHGRVEVDWQLADSLHEFHAIRLVSRAPGIEPQFAILRPGPGGVATFDRVLPGDYEAEFVGGDSGSPDYVTLSDASALSVEADRTTKIELRR